MGLIPRAFLDELLHRTDIVTFIDGYVPLKKQGSSYVACCPFHQEKNPSFNVVAKKQFFHCFGCGVSGNAISFAMQYLNQNFSDAVETLATRMGMQVPREGHTHGQQSHLNLYQLLERVAQFYQHTLNTSGLAAQDYLHSRGVMGEVLERYQLGFAPQGWHTLETSTLKPYQNELVATGMLIKKDSGGYYDRYRNRLMFPIHDRNGRLIGFGGRVLDNTEKPKYLNSPETVIFQKNRELYGLHQVLTAHNKPEQIIVVEGYMDVIALAQMGIRYAVATLGTSASTYHIQLLAKHTSRIVFCFDGDAAGRKAAWRALENSLPSLYLDLDAAFMFLPAEHDPDSFIREHGVARFTEELKQAMPLHTLFFNTLSEGIELKTLAGKSQLLHKIKPYLNLIPNGPYRQLVVAELAKITHLEWQRVEQLLASADTVPQPTIAPERIKRTPTRLAIAMVLQYPEQYAALASEIPSSRFTGKPFQTLQQLMQLIEATPTIRTAALLEHFRDQTVFSALNQLAAWELSIPQAALNKELSDTLYFLAQQIDNKMIETLIERAKLRTLDEVSRLTLQNLLKHRHGVNS